MHVQGGRMQMFVADDGVGIFAKIANAAQLFDTRLAVLELAKGKFTTAPEGHSGIGIFVSSRMMDGFAIESGGLRFDPHDATDALPAFTWMDAKACLKPSGVQTLVRMDLALQRQRCVPQVLRAYRGGRRRFLHH
jgi:hypothetical protein